MTAEVAESTNFNRERGDKSKERVFETVRELAGSLPHEITKYIEIQAQKSAVKKFKEGKINKSEIDSYATNNSLVLRTVHRKLAILLGEGLVEKKKDGKYYVSDLALLSDPRFGEQASGFGQDILRGILSKHYPTLFGTQHNVKKLVESLGFSLLIFSLEAMRPIGDIKEIKAHNLKLLKDRWALAWLSKVIDPQFILDAVISAIGNQLSDEEVELILKKKERSIVL